MIVEFAKSFQRDIERISDSNVLSRLNNVLQTLESVSNFQEIQNLKKLKSSGNYYRIRLGDYRIGLQIENNKIFIVRFLHRKEMYRYFP